MSAEAEKIIAERRERIMGELRDERPYLTLMELMDEITRLRFDLREIAEVSQRQSPAG